MLDISGLRYSGLNNDRGQRGSMKFFCFFFFFFSGTQTYSTLLYTHMYILEGNGQELTEARRVSNKGAFPSSMFQILSAWGNESL